MWTPNIVQVHTYFRFPFSVIVIVIIESIQKTKGENYIRTRKLKRTNYSAAWKRIEYQRKSRISCFSSSVIMIEKKRRAKTTTSCDSQSELNIELLTCCFSSVNIENYLEWWAKHTLDIHRRNVPNRIRMLTRDEKFIALQTSDDKKCKTERWWGARRRRSYAYSIIKNSIHMPRLISF